MNETTTEKIMLSIVVAVYNESPYNLHNLVERLKKVLSTLNMSYEIVFVNDGSKEETTTCLSELCQQYKYIKLVNLSRNFGQQAAISAGMNFASGKAIINIDSDLQDPPELIPDMVNLWQRGFDVVYAKRSSRKDRLLKRLTAFAFYRMMSVLSSIDIPQDTGEFRLVDQRVAKALQLLPERTRYVRGLIPWLGFKQTTIPVNRGARQHGESTYTLYKLLMLALDGVVCFSYAPLYAVAVVGFITIASSVLIPVIWSFTTEHLPIVAWVISAAVFFFGLQFLLLGIVSLYIARIFDEVRARPVYIVSDLAGKAFESSSSSQSQSKHVDKLDYISEQSNDHP